MFAGINGARQPVAVAVADYLHSPRWHLVTKWSGRLKVDWVPGEFDKGFTRLYRVCARNVRAPIAIRIIR